MAAAAHESSNGKHGSLLNACLIVAGAYFARELLMPIAIAMLLAFLLAPLAKWFERLRLGRTPSALVAVLLGLAVIGVLTGFLVTQFNEFGGELPKYEQNLHAKLRHFKMAEGGPLDRATKSLEQFQKDLTPTNAAAGSPSNSLDGAAAGANSQDAVPVVIRGNHDPALHLIGNLMTPMLSLLTTAFLITVFCIFMLIGRDDLRGRMLGLAGPGKAKATHHVLRDTGHRLSRYLLMQLIVNVTYGTAIGLGLWAIGIPNPLLWGMTAMLFRYIPYAGPWIAAALPLAVAVAMDTGWQKPALVIAFFAVVEILTANFLEPLLYGNTTGITPLAVLLAAVFWTWLWGPVGLLLSMPLTVCLVSMAKHVPQLEWLETLFAEPEKKDYGG